MSTELGRAAEERAAAYLERHHKMRIMAKNWRNRFCEIDLVAKDRFGVIHIIEVKYRKSANFGSGFEYITRDKLRRLQRAALAWRAENNYGGDLLIGAVSVEGDRLEYLPCVF